MIYAMPPNAIEKKNALLIQNVVLEKLVKWSTASDLKYNNITKLDTS